MAIIERRRVQLIALAWMLVGSAGIFMMLIIMNQFSEKPEKKVHAYSSQFEVKKPQIVKPKRQEVKKQVKQPAKIAAPLMLEFGSDIAGLDLGLPAFVIGNMNDASLLGNTKDVVMTSDMVDTAARALTRTAVEFPRRARARDIEGYVVISLLIDRTGKVTTAKVIESEPAGVFEEKALQAIRRWLFEPARYKGEAVDSWANQTIRFDLG